MTGSFDRFMKFAVECGCALIANVLRKSAILVIERFRCYYFKIYVSTQLAFCWVHRAYQMCDVILFARRCSLFFVRIYHSRRKVFQRSKNYLC